VRKSTQEPEAAPCAAAKNKQKARQGGESKQGSRAGSERVDHEQEKERNSEKPCAARPRRGGKALAYAAGRKQQHDRKEAGKDHKRGDEGAFGSPHARTEGGCQDSENEGKNQGKSEKGKGTELASRGQTSIVS